DPGSVDALLLDQVGLRVDSALRGESTRMPLVGSCLSYHHSGCIRLLLQVQRHIVEASLGFIVDAAGTPLVAIEADGAKLLDLGSRRRSRRSFHINGAGSGSRLSLVILHVAGY